MNLIKLYVIFRIPLAFLLSFVLNDAKFVVSFKLKVKKILSGIEERSSEAGIFLLYFLLVAVVPFAVFFGIFWLARFFYIPYIAYFGFLLDLFGGSQCIMLKKYLLLKNENPTDTIETASKALCTKSVAPIVLYAIGGSPIAFLYTAIESVSKKIALKSFFDYIFVKISVYVSFICILIFFPIFRPIEALKIYFRDKYKRGDCFGMIAAVFAGSLGIVLGGDLIGDDSTYRPLIGDRLKDIDKKDIKKSKLLCVAVSAFVTALCFIIRLLIEIAR